MCTALNWILAVKKNIFKFIKHLRDACLTHCEHLNDGSYSASIAMVQVNLTSCLTCGSLKKINLLASKILLNQKQKAERIGKCSEEKKEQPV